MEVLKNLRNLQLRIAVGDNSISEEDVRQALNSDIVDYLYKKYQKEITFRNEVKTNKCTFIDSKYENFVIEYKRPSVEIKEKQEEQLFEYLKSLGKYSWGIITNGKEMKIFNRSSDEDNKFVLDENYSGIINEEQFKYICDVISKKETLVLTENNINEYLGIERNKEIIKIIYNKLINTSNKRTLLLYSEWQKLFNLSDEHDKLDMEKQVDVIKFYEELLDSKIDTIQKEHKALFAVQTYYAIVLKLILYKIITKTTKSFESKPRFYIDFFKKIETNNFYREHNILNLIDGDFFSWYLEDFDYSEYDYFYNKVSDVTTVETTRLNLLFIKFYENIFPFWIRHSMGEYYTPIYLADEVVSNTLNISSKNKEEIKLLDPTCGSGIFLLSAINKGVKNVYGIDINPLAVLTSKINYLINNFDLSTPIEIPIYLGDSTYFPSMKIINGIECFEYELTTSIQECQSINFVFSKNSVNEKKFFQILDEIECQIKELDSDGAKNIIKSYDSFQYDDLQKYYDGLINTLIDLEKKGLNSIWLKIIGNYLKSGSIRDVDCVVGNPPWVRWSNLPDNYKLLIKKNCRVDGIFSNDRNSGGVDLNICALITFVTMRERVNKDGILGFIMPDSILFNKSFEGFRNMKISDDKHYYLNKVVRWNNPNEKPFFPVTLDFAEYYFSFNKTDNVKIYDRKDKVDKVAYQNFNSFNNHYIVTTIDDWNKIKPILGRNNLEFHSGISLVKGGYYLLKFHKKINDKISEFYSYERVGGSIRQSQNIIKIETDIVYPYIKSDSVKDNEIIQSNYYCIYPFPYGSKEPYPLETIREKYPNFYNYYMSDKIQTAINSSSDYNKRIQSTSYDIGIFRIGEYTYSDWFLITRDNTKSVFSIVGNLDTPWGEKKMPLFDGHLNYISRFNNKPLTYEKAKELFDIFTKDGIKLYIKYSSDSRSISSRLYNDIKID